MAYNRRAVTMMRRWKWAVPAADARAIAPHAMSYPASPQGELPAPAPDVTAGG